MSRRMESVIVLAIMLCLLSGCKHEVSNEFVENIMSSTESDYDNSNAQEIIGQVISLDENIMRICVLERDMEGLSEAKPAREKPETKKGEKPELEPSKSPTDKVPPEFISNGEEKMAQKLKKTGIELEITIEDTTICKKQGVSITSEDIELDSVVYIEIRNNHTQRIRVSGQKYDMTK